MSRNYNSHAYEYEFFRTIKPAFSYDGGEDFFEWQKKARAKLNELLGLPFEECDLEQVDLGLIIHTGDVNVELGDSGAIVEDTLNVVGQVLNLAVQVGIDTTVGGTGGEGGLTLVSRVVTNNVHVEVLNVTVADQLDNDVLNIDTGQSVEISVTQSVLSQRAKT